MTRKKIVLVVGAGASTEFAPENTFPIGGGLLERIRLTLSSVANSAESPPYQSGDFAREFFKSSDLKSGIAAAQKVAKVVIAHTSIDDLLNEWTDRPDMARVAKIAIAHIVLEAEKRAYLTKTAGPYAVAHHDSWVATRSNWLGELLSALKPTLPKRRISEALEEVAFIIFNYDRSVEKGICNWLTAVTDVDPQYVSEMMERITIIHPHGHLGKLRYGQEFDGYGAEDADFVKAADGIRTYSEEWADLDEIARLRDLCVHAETLAFLGFSYHPNNMKLLFAPGSMPQGEVWGTAYKLEDQRRAIAGISLLGDEKWASEGMSRFMGDSCTSLIKRLASRFALED